MKELNRKKAVVVHSGGQDSTTCLAWALKNFGEDNVQTITFDYGQRHRIEIARAVDISEGFGIENHVIKTDVLRDLTESALLDDNADIAASKDGLPVSFVPGRNMFFLTLASIHCYNQDVSNIVIGVCQTDYSGYPDCRNNSIKSIQTAINLCMETDIRIHTPLMYLTKAETFKMADTLDVLNVIIEDTITCYDGMQIKNAWGYGCGKCPACELRRRGFEEYSQQNT